MVSASTVTGQRLFLSLIARAFGVTGARSRVPESISTRVEDTATIPVATSSSEFSFISFSLSFSLFVYRPYFVLVAPLTRLPLIILSGDSVPSVCSLPTRDRGSAETHIEREKERRAVANVNAGITVFITVSLSLPP